jgi:molybdopterin-guanine dinucleotide biosynthesis protein A
MATMMEPRKTTFIILASGEGSRLSSLSEGLHLPKHLFPIGRTTITERILAAASPLCEQLLVVTPPKWEDTFRKKLDPHVHVSAKKGAGFQADFEAACKEARHEHLIVTAGDIIFADDELARFISSSQQHPEKIFLGLDSRRILIPKFQTVVDFQIVAMSMPRRILLENLSTHPESFVAMTRAFLGHLLMGKMRIRMIRTLFNINTPESYERAKLFFS